MPTLAEKRDLEQPFRPGDITASEEQIHELHACKRCWSQIMYTPVIVCTACKGRMPIQCYVYKRKGHFYGECLTLNLVSRGATQEEAILRLQRATFAYVEAVFADGKSTVGLIPRRAPFASQFRYQVHLWKRRLSHHILRRRSRAIIYLTQPSPDSPAYIVAEC